MVNIDEKITLLLDANNLISPELKEAQDQFTELKEMGIIKNSSYDIPLMHRLTVLNRKEPELEPEQEKIAALTCAQRF